MRPSVTLALATTTLLVAACGPEPSAPDTSAETARPAEGVTAARAAFGAITIALDMRANRTTDIAYITGGKKLKRFSLDDDGDPTLPSSRTFTRLKPGAYTVQQAAVAGVELTDIVCASSPNGGSGSDNNTVDLANRSVTIQLERDETVGCTFQANQPIWEENDFITWTQGEWGDESNAHEAALLLDARFNTVYPFGTLEVGISGVAGFSIVFDGNGVLDFLPTLGTPGPLTGDLLNPSISPGGTFAGDVVGLELNTDFAGAGFLPSGFGHLTLCGVPGVPSSTVDQLLGVANTLLGGGSSALVFDRVREAISQVNASFLAGSPTPWAQDHLVSGACP